MKQKTADRIVYLLLIIGTVICCVFSDTLAGIVVLIAGVGIIAVLWIRFIAAVLLDEAKEEAERLAEERFQEMVDTTEYHVEFRQFVGLGKGYK